MRRLVRRVLLISLCNKFYFTSTPRCGELPSTHLEILGSCTDAGPDQLLARKTIGAYVESCMNILWFDSNCLIHQYHLIVRQGLAIVDEALVTIHQENPTTIKGYFSSLAKTTNTWRANALAISSEWSNQHPELSAKGRKMPPQCIAGRFGSIDNTEAHFIDLGQQRTTKCLETTLQLRLATKATKRKRTQPEQDHAKPVENKADDGDGNAGNAELVALLSDPLDEVKAYRAKMSKWKQGTVDACRDSVFWY